jgi:hypothetical protein
MVCVFVWRVSKAGEMPQCQWRVSNGEMSQSLLPVALLRVPQPRTNPFESLDSQIKVRSIMSGFFHVVVFVVSCHSLFFNIPSENNG